jgi:predicted ATPase
MDYSASAFCHSSRSSKIEALCPRSRQRARLASGPYAGTPVCHHPLAGGPTRRWGKAFAQLTNGAAGESTTLSIKGRLLYGAAGGPQCRLVQLWGSLLDAARLAITERFAAIILEAIPHLAAQQRNDARRFNIPVTRFTRPAPYAAASLRV